MPLYDPTENVPVFDQIKAKDACEKFLKVFVAEYVHRHGLGGMSKTDLDALLVYMFLNCTRKPFDSFELSELFRVKESRIKSLMETAAVKFEENSEETIWMTLIQSWIRSTTEVESLDKGQVVFKLENPAHFRFLQKEARAAGGTVAYSKTSEAITVSLATLFKVLDQVYSRVFANKTGHQYLVKGLLEKIKTDLIGHNELKKIKGDKEKKLKLTQVLSTASNLSSIGKFIIAVFPLI